ncbi:unnamed protein product [Enterobius vermicularis]|uniref:VWFA domain-containing protein n=1 Tax=Enterobius vermicularis TaxID=51028 RepID=A0A0N4V9A2_ENTVE|nr:unnamed protein product [Enterobius vermicularis]
MLQQLITQAGSCSSGNASSCTEKGSDIVFVLDESGSVSDQQFKQLIESCYQMVSMVSIGTGAQEFRFGFVLFSHTARLIFNVSAYENKDVLLKKIKEIVRGNGNTDIMKGMLVALDEGYEQGSGRSRTMIVMTDGDTPYTDEDFTKLQKSLSRNSVTAYGVGIGNGVKNETLTKLVGSEARVRNIDKYDELFTAVRRIVC